MDLFKDRLTIRVVDRAMSADNELWRVRLFGVDLLELVPE
jgi:hypothetical protein